MKRYMTFLTLAFGLGVIGLAYSTSSSSQQDESAENADLAKATFAGGCFWCMEPPFDKLDGVVSTTSGYAGGHTDNPTYQEVSSGGTGHAEVVQITYDPDKVSYSTLLDVFWHNIDPTQKDRQFCDVGDQYRTAIFYHNDEQKRLAEQTREELKSRFSEAIHTEIEPLEAFYPAEDYHQNFYQTHPRRYKQYRMACGRDERLEEIWGNKAKTAAK